MGSLARRARHPESARGADEPLDGGKKRGRFMSFSG
jgi:hypothetical protein